MLRGKRHRPKVAGIWRVRHWQRQTGRVTLPAHNGIEECLPSILSHFVWEDSMVTSQRSWPLDRRTLLKSTAAIAAVQFSSPFIIKARGETPVRIGMVDPLTGVYAAIAQGEVVGAKFAAEEINKKGGILGRPVELLIEDSANDVGTGVQKTRKLIERDQVSFIVGDVNSGIAIAMAQVTSE